MGLTKNLENHNNSSLWFKEINVYKKQSVADVERKKEILSKVTTVSGYSLIFYCFFLSFDNEG